MTAASSAPGNRETPTPTRRQRWLRRIVALAFLGMGGAAVAALALTTDPPEPLEQSIARQAVAVEVAETFDDCVEIRANGVVRAEEEIDVVAEVGGRVRWVHPEFVIGGKLSAKTPLLRLDRRDYRVALQRAKGERARARAELAKARSRARAARREWRRSKRRGAVRGKPSALTLRKPQLAAAKAALRGARAAVRKARLDLSRTTLRAPFDLVVSSERVDRGQVVRPGQRLGHVLGTTRARVVVPLPRTDLSFLTIGTDAGDDDCDDVRIALRSGDERATRRGRLERAVGVIAKGRLPRVVVSFTDPLARRAKGPGRQRIDFGSFVSVSLRGRRLADAVRVPAEAIRRGSRVFLVGQRDRLQIHRVRVARLDGARALVTRGLAPGARVIVGELRGAVEGMPLDPRPAGTSDADDGDLARGRPFDGGLRHPDAGTGKPAPSPLARAGAAR